jgi:hypothetical protein
MRASARALPAQATTSFSSVDHAAPDLADLDLDPRRAVWKAEQRSKTEVSYQYASDRLSAFSSETSSSGAFAISS